jgi:GMP synthase (glutamine-hydrolysing)
MCPVYGKLRDLVILVLFIIGGATMPDLCADESSGEMGLDWTKGLFDDPGQLNKDPAPFVCYINSADPSELAGPEAKPSEISKVKQLKRRAEELSGLRCLALHYTQLTRKDLDKPNVRAVLFTAWKPMRDEFHKSELYAMLREIDAPLIGFCGGMHQICLAWGGKVGTMRKLRPGEKDPCPEYTPGEFKEWGPFAVKMLKRNPLFEGFGTEMVMYERHCGESKELPPDFENFASTEECKFQVVKHRQKPLYGTQFHPEVYDDEHPDGRTLLINFLKLSKGYVDARYRAFLAEVHGEKNAEAVKAAYDAVEEARRGYSMPIVRSYGPKELKADLRRIEAAVRALPSGKTPMSDAGAPRGDAGIAQLKKDLTAVRSTCRWRAEVERLRGMSDCEAIVKTFNKLGLPDLGEEARGEWALVQGLGDLGRDTKNVVMSVNLLPDKQNHELKGWSDRIESPLLDNQAYRTVAGNAKAATIRFVLDAGACILQVTAYRHPEAAKRGGCAISMDGKVVARFDDKDKLPTGWVTKNVGVLLQPTEGSGRTLTFTPTTKSPLPMTTIILRRLRVAGP